MDEISLASDAVLERLNSLLEFERKILIETEGLEMTQEIKANENFMLIATMNPSGDHGKKELSPALRNRFTEIWTESPLSYDSLNDKDQQEDLDNFISKLTDKFKIQQD